MGSYGRVEEDLDEYEDDFVERDEDEYADEYEDEEEEEEEEEEVKPMSAEEKKLLQFRQKLKDRLRKESGGSSNGSRDQIRRPSLSNFGNFFGPSRPVIAERVIQESKALLERQHLAPKASTSQNEGKKVSSRPSTSAPSTSAPSTSAPRNGVSRQSLASEVKSKVRILKDTRDYSFLLDADSDTPKPKTDPGPQRNLGSKPDVRPSQVSARGNGSSSHSAGRLSNGSEQQKVSRAPQASSARDVPPRKLTSSHANGHVSSDSRRQLDLRKKPETTRDMGSNGVSRPGKPALAKALPSKKPSTSTGQKVPSSSVERKATVGSVSNRPPPPVRKPSLSNGQRPTVEKSRSSGAGYPMEHKRNVQNSSDNKLVKKENLPASRMQMKPPKQRPPQGSLDRDCPKVHKPAGQLNGRNHSNSIRKEPINKKRKAEEVDDVGDYRSVRSVIRNIFKYNPDRYNEADDDDDDMCMEVGFDTILREEKRSAAIARKEDEEELAKIMEEERQEKLRKQAKMRKMSR